MLLCGSVRAAENRAGEILERLAAGFRAMKGYEVTFEVEAGEYRTAGSYAVEGQGYFLTLGDAEVFCDGTVRYEVDNARREVTIVGVDTASRNILNNPVRAFDFLGSEYLPTLVSEAGGQAVVRLTPAASGEDAGAAAEALHSGPGEQSFSLLVAEDNEDLLMVMKNILEPKYRIFTAKDGKQALEILRKEAVSLVITDYVMPVMGGLELCRKIRADLSLSHIPVIMLSARTARENKLRAFDAGVDAYITKPFEVKLLIAQVDGILANRSRLYTKFRSGENAETDLLISTDMDRQFVENTIRVIENHISDPDFGIEAFNAEMNMSNSTLYRKIKGVTGMSPKEFIRNIRFKYACRLLLEKTTSVADVAFMVGFTDAKYFSLTFKKEFGLTPSQYIAEHKKKAGQDKNSGSGQDN